MFLTRSSTKAAIILVWMVSASAWAADSATTVGATTDTATAKDSTDDLDPLGEVLGINSVIPKNSTSYVPNFPVTGTTPSDVARNTAASTLFRKHNLTPTGIGTGEICAFCHTPQGAESNVSAPLWNPSAPPVSPYLAYASLGSATEEATGSISMACLSCHDGTQAPNILIRTPDHNADIGTGRLKAPDSVRSDLRSHHPVGMRYSGGGQDQNQPTAPLGTHDDGGGQNQTVLSNRVDPPNPVDVDTFNNVDFKMTSHAGSGSGTVWWVENGKPHKERRKTDLYLFTRTDRTDYAGIPIPTEDLNRPYVECATCHDVMGSNPTFLRFPNTGSAICLTCHNK